MSCEPIRNLTFSPKSIEALKDIEGFKRNGDFLVKMLGAGTVGNIFLGNNAPTSLFNLSTTDLEQLTIA